MFDTLSEKFSDAFKHIQGKSKISEENIDETLKAVRTALLEADVNFKVVKAFMDQVKEKALGEKVLRGVDPGQQFIKIIHDELAAVMGGEHQGINFSRKELLPVLVVGLNGAGKTTLSGKLSLYLRKKEKKDVLLVPCDTFRPAAKDQLMVLAKNMAIDCFDSDLSLSPREVALQGLAYAKEKQKEIVIIDTAGRLHVDAELMEELKDLKNAISMMNPEVLLVADAMTGQEASEVAKTFHEAIGLTGVVLSKMDSDARGGAALSIRSVTGVPISFISTGEKMKDLELFHPDRMAGRILDMGDIVSLVEKAEEVMDAAEAERMMKRMEKKEFSIDDFMNQMNTMSKLGSMGSLMKMIPGMGGVLRQMGDLSPAEDEMKKMKVIISSMTLQERKNDKLLNTESRKKRIALGSGKEISDVTDFVNKFRQMRNMMSGLMGMMKGGGLGSLFGGGAGGMPDMSGLGGMGGGAQKGFRQMPGISGKTKKKGKGKGPWGGGYF